MRVLIVGHSAIAGRRVLPALRSLPAVSRVHVATRRVAAVRERAAADGIDAVHDGLEAALATGPFDLAYVSLPNALHADAAARALEAGCHVVVDKPACTTLEDTERLLALAAARGRLLAEATVWSFHPVWTRLDELVAETGCTLRHVVATFVFPTLPPTDFRRSVTLGGGACLDVGPYAASCARRFVGPPEALDDLHAVTLDRDPVDVDGHAPGVDRAFALLARRGARTFTGQFGFGAAYANRLELIGDTARFLVEPAFSAPPDAMRTIRWRHRDIDQATPVEPADPFARFLGRVVADIEAGTDTHAEWARQLRDDAHFLARLQRATREAT